jgi:hypothetical protein
MEKLIIRKPGWDIEGEVKLPDDLAVTRSDGSIRMKIIDLVSICKRAEIEMRAEYKKVFQEWKDSIKRYEVEITQEELQNYIMGLEDYGKA